MKENKALWWIFGFIASLSLASALSILESADRQGTAYSNSFLALFFGLLCAFSFLQVRDRADGGEKRGYWLSLIFSGAFGLALVVGKKLETVENLNIMDAAVWINGLILTFFFRPYVQLAWQWMAALGRGGEESKGQKEAATAAERPKDTEWFFTRKDFWINLGVIFLCWLPVFMAFYPGAFVYDAQDEYVQVAARSFTTHHPLVHVLLLGGFVAGGNKLLGSYNLGIACYTLFQMAVMAAVFSYTLIWIKRRWRNKWLSLGGILFYGLFPVIPMYAVCSAKDGLFTAAFLVVVLQMLTLFEEPERFLKKKSNWLAGILAAATMMLLRNNGSYAYMVWIPVAAAGTYFIDKKRRGAQKLCFKTALLCLLAVALFSLLSKGLAWGLGAEKGGRQELLTVPIQQLARTYHYSPQTFTGEEKEVLLSFLEQERLEKYNPRLSDIVKSGFNNKRYAMNGGEFLQLWAKIGLRKPLIYLNGWLMTSYGFWYPDALINVYGGNTVHTFTYGESSYFGFETEAPGFRESKFPWLEEQYRKLSLEIYQQRIPGLSMLFSPGFMFWVYAFFMGFFLWQKGWRKLVPFLLILLIWLTVLLGPTYLVRYVLILWFVMPLIVSQVKVCYSGQENDDNHKEGSN